jgi:hypothetical protein
MLCLTHETERPGAPQQQRALRVRLVQLEQRPLDFDPVVRTAM